MLKRLRLLLPLYLQNISCSITSFMTHLKNYSFTVFGKALQKAVPSHSKMTEVKINDLRYKTTNLTSCENSDTSLILTQESNATSREVILLFSLSCGKVKYAVSNPVPSFQNSMHSFKDTQRKS